MKPEYVSLIAGFVGVIVGALTSLATTWLQQCFQARRERARLALDAAVREHESAESHAKFMADQGKRVITYDLPYYIALHSALFERIGKRGGITKTEWVQAHKQAIELSEAAVEFHKERRAQQGAPADRPQKAAAGG